MNNQNFKVRIVDFYKDMNKPSGLYEDSEVKDLLMLSNKTEFPLLQKEKDKWIIKNKGKILKDIDSMKKKKVKEFTSNVNNYNNIDELKNNNNKIIADLESIDILKKSIGDDKLYLRLENLALLNNKSYKKNKELQHNNNNHKEEKEKANYKQEKANYKQEKINYKQDKEIIKGKIKNNNKIELSELSQFSSETEDYIEVFSNSTR